MQSFARRVVPFTRLRGDLCEDREKVLAAVKERAVALRFAAPDVVGDREVILAAVASTGNPCRILCFRKRWHHM